VNEQRVQQVLDIEKQAQTIYDEAVREAERLPKQAEREAEDLIEKTRAEATEKAHQLVANVEVQAERERILGQAEEEVKRMEALAMSHFERAVGYVLDRVAGRE
jgi:vacuolar-type H+-ATPase subunit H